MERDAPVLILLTIGVGLGMLAAGREGDHNKKPDLTGAWELNVNASDFGKTQAPTRMTLKSINHEGVLHSVQTRYGPRGAETSEGDWFVDGKEHRIGADGKVMESSHWAGNSIVAEQKSNDDSYDQLVRMDLSADGRTATETVTVKTPNGVNKSTLIWIRKNNPS